MTKKIHVSYLVSLLITYLLTAWMQEQSPVKEVRRQTASCSSPVLNDADELRQMLMKKNEKIEFLKDHIDQLLEEMHRKSRYITCSLLIMSTCVNCYL